MINSKIILENYRNYLLTDKTCKFVIKFLCTKYKINFRSSMIFIDEHITFIHRENNLWSSDSGSLLWAYPIEKYKLMLHSNDTYTNNIYSKISDNAVILLNINGINPQKNNVSDDYLVRYITACFYFIRKHHILDNKNSWQTKIKVIDFAQKCIDNLCWRYKSINELNKSILTTNNSNVNAVYNAKHAITLGTAPLIERQRITKKITKNISNMKNSKFTQEEKDFVVEHRKSGFTIEKTMLLFKDKFGKSISLGTVRKMTNGVVLPKKEKKYVKRTPLGKEKKKFIIDTLLKKTPVDEVTRMFKDEFGETIPVQTVYSIRRKYFTNEEKNKLDFRKKKTNNIKNVMAEAYGLDFSKFILTTSGKIKACPYNYMVLMKQTNQSVTKSGSNFVLNGKKVPNIHPNDLRRRLECGMLKEDPITPLIDLINLCLCINKEPKMEDIYAALVMCLQR